MWVVETDPAVQSQELDHAAFSIPEYFQSCSEHDRWMKLWNEFTTFLLIEWLCNKANPLLNEFYGWSMDHVRQLYFDDENVLRFVIIGLPNARH